MNRRDSGHTIVELLIVALVLGLLAGIVMPSASVGDDRKLDTVQLEIQDALDHAQAMSYHKGAVYAVRFNEQSQWFGVVNEVGALIDDPLSHGDYIVRLKEPGQPHGVIIDYAMYGTRPLAAFDAHGVLTETGEIHLRVGETERWLTCNTSTATLKEIPVAAN